MQDNYKIIEPLLNFEDPDKFYFLQIIQRKKDFTDRSRVNGTNNNNRLVKPYYVSNKEYFDFIKPEVIQLCKVFKARACLNLNRRSWKKSSLHHLKKVTDQIMNEDWRHAYKAYSHVVGSYSQEPNKTWILDYDGGEMPYQQYKDLKNKLAQVQPLGQKVVETIPSNNGLHIISKPFNLKLAKPILEKYEIEVHKNNPTNLYIPDL